MSNENLSESNNPKIFIKQAGELLDTLFLDPEKKYIVAKLFEGFSWLVREQKINDTLKTTKWWLENLKNTIV